MRLDPRIPITRANCVNSPERSTQGGGSQLSTVDGDHDGREPQQKVRQHTFFNYMWKRKKIWGGVAVRR